MQQRSPFFWAVLAGLAVLLAAFVPVGWQMLRGPSPQPPADAAAPWRIERGTQGELHAFGLRLPGSTLADARQRWGDELQVAIIASRTQPATLEAYVERWSGGGLGGRLVLATDAPAAALARWQQAAARHERIDAQAERWTLRAGDLDEALRSAVTGISFLPAARLDAASLEARFGRPAERIDTGGGLQHWLYADRGLAIAWQADRGRAVVQLVPPADFEARLRAPLGASAAAPAASGTR